MRKISCEGAGITLDGEAVGHWQWQPWSGSVVIELFPIFHEPQNIDLQTLDTLALETFAELYPGGPDPWAIKEAAPRLYFDIRLQRQALADPAIKFNDRKLLKNLTRPQMETTVRVFVEELLNAMDAHVSARQQLAETPEPQDPETSPIDHIWSQIDGLPAKLRPS